MAAGSFEVLVEELRSRGGVDAAHAPIVEALEQALAQGTGLTRRLLQFSRQRQGQPRDVEVFEALRGMSALLRQLLGQGVTLELRGQPGVPPVWMDPVDLEQVVINLVINLVIHARDAMAATGKLSISVDALPPGRWVRVGVDDTGCGMSAEVRERIFEPFFTTKSADRGTGLGLSTVFAIVHGLGGRIAVSSSPGAGTEFRLYFPASKAS